MFKFMKSKKGFSLVELMIVVVIMAILVVVAVPIYNSVTDNARAKTCLDNQRTLLSNLNTIIMDKGVTGKGSFTVVTSYENEKPKMEINGLDSFTEAMDDDDITGSFQTIPVCGAQDGVITVTVTAGANGAMPTIDTACLVAGESNAKHVLAD